eukprot:952211-Alexandrium_andersonii.AAC.1
MLCIPSCYRADVCNLSLLEAARVGNKKRPDLSARVESVVLSVSPCRCALHGVLVPMLGACFCALESQLGHATWFPAPA